MSTLFLLHWISLLFPSVIFTGWWSHRIPHHRLITIRPPVTYFTFHYLRDNIKVIDSWQSLREIRWSRRAIKSYSPCSTHHVLPLLFVSVSVSTALQFRSDYSAWRQRRGFMRVIPFANGFVILHGNVHSSFSCSTLLCHQLPCHNLCVSRSWVAGKIIISLELQTQGHSTSWARNSFPPSAVAAAARSWFYWRQARSPQTDRIKSPPILPHDCGSSLLPLIMEELTTNVKYVKDSRTK